MAEKSKIDMVGLGSRIRKARADCHMSQTELADACGLSVPYVHKHYRCPQTSFFSLMYLKATMHIMRKRQTFLLIARKKSLLCC